MSHDIEAAWAGAELAAMLSGDPSICFDVPTSASDVSVYASREGKSPWPLADGVLEVNRTGTAVGNYNIALEYKRPNEGVHGILTALGQSHAYLHKGYVGSAIVIPQHYSSLPDAAIYANNVIEATSQSDKIGVFGYVEPDPLKPSPFSGRIQVFRNLKIDTAGGATASATLSKPASAQWAHVREGSSDPDAFFRYLQCVKLVSGDQFSIPSCYVPKDLERAVGVLAPGVDILGYLSYATGNTIADKAWRLFWFKYILSDDMMVGWTRSSSGAYEVNHVEADILKIDGSGKKNFFSGRANSVKNKAVAKLNTGTSTEAEMWELLAKNFHERAHSYREDIDSGLEFIGYLEPSGRMSESGFRFLDACERSGDPNSGVPISLLGRALLSVGGMGSFLHYVYRLSSQKFASNPMAFSEETSAGSGHYKIKQHEYLSWLENELAVNLKVMRKVSSRGGVSRKPFQAELAILRHLGFIDKGFRLGVGVPVNWPQIQRVLAAEGVLSS